MVPGIAEMSEMPWGEVLLTVKLLAGEEYHSDYRAASRSRGGVAQARALRVGEEHLNCYRVDE